MSDDPPRRRPGYMTEDLQPRLVDPIDDYSREPAAPVAVSYLWADDTAGAAGYLPSYGGGPVAVNLASRWVDRLRAAKARDLAPSAALAEIDEAGRTEYGEPGLVGEAMPFEQLPSLGGYPRSRESAPRRRRPATARSRPPERG